MAQKRVIAIFFVAFLGQLCAANPGDVNISRLIRPGAHIPARSRRVETGGDRLHLLQAECYTVSGDDPNKPCIFPFSQYGVVYDRCAPYSNSWWCATVVDEDGVVVPPGYGFCHDDCLDCTHLGCDDSTQCTDFTCDTSTGLCLTLPAPDDTPCDDDDGMTVDDSCQNGVCVSGHVAECYTVSGDDPNKACIFPFEQYGVVYDKCAPYSNSWWCATVVDADGVVVPPGYGFCHDDCLDCTHLGCGDPTQCIDYPCDASTGLCSPPVSTDGTPCDDGDSLTVGDSCQNGVCVSGPLPECYTVSGDDPNQLCVFPFEYGGVVYETCALSSYTDKFWCQTADDWGYCNTDCVDCVERGCTDPANECVIGTCEGAFADLVCSTENAPSSTTCDDGDPDTVASCRDGVCTGVPDCGFDPSIAGNSPGTSVKTTIEVDENACMLACSLEGDYWEPDSCLAYVFHHTDGSVKAGTCFLLDRQFEENFEASTASVVANRISCDPPCETGIQYENKCCLDSCGTCGGDGCETRPGGEAGCCITATNVYCSSNPPPCLLGTPEFTVHVFVTDASTGNPIAGASVTLTPSGEQTLSGTADAQGMVQFVTILQNVVDVSASSTGYISVSRQVDLFDSTDVNLALSELLTDAQVLSVLTWGQVPDDLDANVHVISSNEWWTEDYIHWNSRLATTTSGASIELDIDDVDGSGPETISFDSLPVGVYSYKVHSYYDDDYEEGPANTFYRFNGAVVTLFVGSKDPISWNQPTIFPSSWYWHVFNVKIQQGGVCPDLGITIEIVDAIVGSNGGGSPELMHDGSVVSEINMGCFSAPASDATTQTTFGSFGKPSSDGVSMDSGGVNNNGPTGDKPSSNNHPKSNKQPSSDSTGFGSAGSTGGGFGNNQSSSDSTGFGSAVSAGVGFGDNQPSSDSTGFGTAVSTGGGFGNNQPSSDSSGFGSAVSTGGGFGNTQPSSDSTGFGSAVSTGGGFGDTQPSSDSTGFGSAASTGSGFGNTQPTSDSTGFGSAVSTGSGFGDTQPSSDSTGFGSAVSAGGGFGDKQPSSDSTGFGSTASAGGGFGDNQPSSDSTAFKSAGGFDLRWGVFGVGFGVAIVLLAGRARRRKGFATIPSRFEAPTVRLQYSG